MAMRYLDTNLIQELHCKKLEINHCFHIRTVMIISCGFSKVHVLMNCKIKDKKTLFRPYHIGDIAKYNSH